MQGDWQCILTTNLQSTITNVGVAASKGGGARLFCSLATSMRMRSRNCSCELEQSPLELICLLLTRVEVGEAAN